MDDYILTVLLQQEEALREGSVKGLKLDDPTPTGGATMAGPEWENPGYGPENAEVWGTLRKTAMEKLLKGMAQPTAAPQVQGKSYGNQERDGNARSFRGVEQAVMTRQGGTAGWWGISPEALSMYYQRDARRYTREAMLC